MRNIILGLVGAGAILAAAPAAASGGCGAGFHRGPYGRCLVNRAVVVTPRPVVVAPRPVVVVPPPVVGRWYPGRGYWNGHRYYWHRTRARGVWVYR